MQFYGAKEVMVLLNISRSKAYKIIKTLSENIQKEGKMCPKAGQIQKFYFCKNFMLEPEECEEILAIHKNANEVSCVKSLENSLNKKGQEGFHENEVD